MSGTVQQDSSFSSTSTLWMDKDENEDEISSLHPPDSRLRVLISAEWDACISGCMMRPRHNHNVPKTPGISNWQYWPVFHIGWVSFLGVSEHRSETIPLRTHCWNCQKLVPKPYTEIEINATINQITFLWQDGNSNITIKSLYFAKNQQQVRQVHVCRSCETATFLGHTYTVSRKVPATKFKI